jgi:diamine N-acetyltransferase
MPEKSAAIPDLTIETLSRSFYKESVNYGFTQMDYVRFVNRLLDLSMQDGERPAPTSDETVTTSDSAEAPAAAIALPLSGPRIRVRAFAEPDDATLLEQWISEPDGRYFLLSRTTSREVGLADLLHSDGSVLGMITLPDDRPIGCVAFLDLDREQRKAELRKLVGDPSERGKGYGKEASALWIRYGLTALGLKKIYLNTLETNIRNVHLNEELGFRVEGILRNEVFIDGEYRDVLRMGLWRE